MSKIITTNNSCYYSTQAKSQNKLISGRKSNINIGNDAITYSQLVIIIVSSVGKEVFKHMILQGIVHIQIIVVTVLIVSDRKSNIEGQTLTPFYR